MLKSYYSDLETEAMPSKTKHLSIATKNEKFFDHFDLNNSPFIEWAVTGLFYSLLHYIDAYLAERLKCHPRIHGTRTTLVSTESDLHGIYDKYRYLKDQSEGARYYGVSFTPKTRQVT